MLRLKPNVIIQSYRKVPRFFVFALAAFCWLAALTQLILAERQSAAGGLLAEPTVPAYSSNDSVLKSGNYRLCAVSEQTYELFSQRATISSNTISEHLKTLLRDDSIQCVFSQQTSGYHDLYLYSPALNTLGIAPIGQGYNLHVAVTDNGHVYLGFPNITYDY